MNRLLATMALAAFALPAVAQDVARSPNGIAIPDGWQDWRIIAPSHRTDNETLRAILGNDIAIAAARAGETNPWPDGATMAKIVWKDREDENWDSATVPGKFIHVEFMMKDAARYKDTVGWGFARWLGEGLEPYGEDADVAEECVGCHTPVQARDYVFTTPAVLPH
ncbi:MAG: cytochrome P460 family protein [Marinibacterium sp.]